MKLLLLGDACIDLYYYGHINRISPEAPVPILDVVDWEERFGMVYNVNENLTNLNFEVDLIQKNTASKKTRFIDIKSKQHIIRCDQDPEREPVNLVDVPWNEYDAVVISDYGKGSINHNTFYTIKNKFNRPIFLDTKNPNLGLLENFYIKINETERANAKSLPSKYVITTLGSRGAEYNGKLYPAEKVECVDVCGAGDTFFATFVYGMLHYDNIDSAIELANQAAALSVKHIGTYAPSQKELIAI